MSKAKGRMMRAAEVRTGDRVMPVGTAETRLVTHARQRDGQVRLTHGRQWELTCTPDTWLRVVRPSRRVDLDATELVVRPPLEPS